MSAQHTPQSGLERAAQLELKAKNEYENYFHKIRAGMSFGQWRMAFNVGFRCGREEATQDWADHMGRVASAIGGKS